MQQNHVLEKFNFDLLTQSPGLGDGGGVGLGVSRQNIYGHVASLLILDNLIRNMTIF